MGRGFEEMRKEFDMMREGFAKMDERFEQLAEGRMKILEAAAKDYAMILEAIRELAKR